jgi:DNA-binding XRE family transcriptional regulator
MTVATLLDVAHARSVVEQAKGLGLGSPARSRRGGVPTIPDILLCTFDVERDAFRIVYVDGSARDLARSELPDVGPRQVVAWEVDAFRRGVEIALDDGAVTSFSAEFPCYLHDEDYRRLVDARRGPKGQDLGERVAMRVREERERLGWSSAELARRADMAAPNLHRVESGKHVPAMQTVARLATALGVPFERLLRA